jgi:hypothetical protein
MGDGQHGWAAAEWAMMIRNLFIREEGDRLILGSGIFPEWLESGKELHFGPTLTPYGRVSVSVGQDGGEPLLQVDATWHEEQPEVEIQVPGYKAQGVGEVNRKYALKRV